MRAKSIILELALLLAPAALASAARHGLLEPEAEAQQLPLSDEPDRDIGHFSEWSRDTKKQFLIDWQEGRESEWTIVQGNEAGDLDSMTSALTWAYHLEHSTANTSDPRKAIALLQTPTHALDLRPENKLALKRSKMTRGHEDLLTSDELPEDPETLGAKLRGIVLVDHAKPLRRWRGAEVLSIFDHHVDVGSSPGARPRVFEKAASCTTLVARQMLDELEGLPGEYHMPHELLELMLSAIAIDSDGLEADVTTRTDVDVARRAYRRSNWAGHRALGHVMGDLNDELKKAKKDLDHLGVRDLLRRDWKGDVIDTPSPRTPTVSLGFASIPYSMDQQIEKTYFQELFNWFAVEASWTAEVGVDVSVILSKHKVKKHGKKVKIREITLIVRDDVRIDGDQADSLFETVRGAMEADPTLDLVPWHRHHELSPRQMVWVDRSGSSRKIVRPIVERAVTDWD